MSAGTVPPELSTPPRVDRPVLLTAHPLQRIGAYALAALAGVRDPAELDQDRFADAVRCMTADAVRAALGRDTKVDDGFYLKCSMSLFPNSPMFHPSNAKRTNDEIAARVTAWRTCPDAGSLPGGMRCVLCARAAVGFFGKMDVPLAESDAYRNSTPREHEGMALCWGCVCCFHALPYGVRLTGGPSLALHSWDTDFLASSVAEQQRRTRRVIELGAARQSSLPTREVLALRALRSYEHRLRAGVELMVFSNNNRGPELAVHELDRSLAEWLRRTMRYTRLKAGFVALLHAHRYGDVPGQVGLARTVFRAPERVVATCARYLAMVAFRQRRGDGRRWDEIPDLAALCFDYAVGVMRMNKSDLDEIQRLARRVSIVATDDGQEWSLGRLREFHSLFAQPSRLRGWLLRQAVQWAAQPRDEPGPLVTSGAFGLLFDPDYDNPAWFHRQMFLVAVIEQLHERGWRPAPVDGAEDDADIESLPDLDDGPDQEDRRLVDGLAGEDGQ